MKLWTTLLLIISFSSSKAQMVQTDEGIFYINSDSGEGTAYQPAYDVNGQIKQAYISGSGWQALYTSYIGNSSISFTATVVTKRLTVDSSTLTTTEQHSISEITYKRTDQSTWFKGREMETSFTLLPTAGKSGAGYGRFAIAHGSRALFGMSTNASGGSFGWIGGIAHPVTINGAEITLYSVDSVTGKNTTIRIIPGQGLMGASMTTIQREHINNPLEGLQVYDTDLHKLCYFDGTQWQQISSKPVKRKHGKRRNSGGAN